MKIPWSLLELDFGDYTTYLGIADTASDDHASLEAAKRANADFASKLRMWRNGLASPQLRRVFATLPNEQSYDVAKSERYELTTAWYPTTDEIDWTGFEGRGGPRAGARRPTNESKGLPVRQLITFRIAPEYAAWAEQQVQTGRFRSVGEYIENLINRDQVDRERP